MSGRFPRIVVGAATCVLVLTVAGSCGGSSGEDPPTPTFAPTATPAVQQPHRLCGEPRYGVDLTFTSDATPRQCLSWVDDFADEEGFRVEVRYSALSEPDSFRFPANTVEAILPGELIRTPTTRDQCIAFKNYEIKVFALRSGEEFVGSVGHQTEKDCTALPAE